MLQILNADRSAAAETAAVHSGHFASCSEPVWLQSLTVREPRPNLLIWCPGVDTGSVVHRLIQMCRPPIHVCLPDRWELPSRRVGTLLLHDVAALTVVQQIELFDWVSDHVGITQVISVSSAPLHPLVEDGRFLEGLFYRLNVVHVTAATEHIVYSCICQPRC
jgi:hypothetical protein